MSEFMEKLSRVQPKKSRKNYNDESLWIIRIDKLATLRTLEAPWPNLKKIPDMPVLPHESTLPCKTFSLKISVFFMA